MMIAELIDGDDFRQRLMALGVQLPEGACPETCARLARRMQREVGVPGLEAEITALMAHDTLILAHREPPLLPLHFRCR